MIAPYKTALKEAPIIGRWAGVRPRNTIDGRGTAPWFGPVPEYEGLIAMIGGRSQEVYDLIVGAREQYRSARESAEPSATKSD